MIGPAVERCEVFSVQQHGQHTQLTVIAPTVAAGFRPGQFVTMAVGDADSALVLPHVPSVSGATASDTYAGTLSFVVDPTGAGARWLAGRMPGDHLTVVGPLGNGFPLPVEPARVVLVGVGHHAAALLPLTAALLAGGSSVEVVLGAESAGQLFGEMAMKRLVGSVGVVTDDGSAGERALLADVLADVIAGVDAEAVYACGPSDQLAVVSSVAAAHEVRIQVALMVPMACGTGLCGGCGVLTDSRAVLACSDGPVLDGGHVNWDDLLGRRIRTSAGVG